MQENELDLPFVPFYSRLFDKTVQLLRERTSRDGDGESALLCNCLLLRFDDEARQRLDEFVRVGKRVHNWFRRGVHFGDSADYCGLRFTGEPQFLWTVLEWKTSESVLAVMNDCFCVRRRLRRPSSSQTDLTGKTSPAIGGTDKRQGPNTAQVAPSSATVQKAAAAGVATPRRKKDKGDKDKEADIVKRLQAICTPADPTKLYRNLVKIGAG